MNFDDVASFAKSGETIKEYKTKGGRGVDFIEMKGESGIWVNVYEDILTHKRLRRLENIKNIFQNLVSYVVHRRSNKKRYNLVVNFNLKEKKVKDFSFVTPNPQMVLKVISWLYEFIPKGYQVMPEKFDELTLSGDSYPLYLKTLVRYISAQKCKAISTYSIILNNEGRYSDISKSEDLVDILTQLNKLIEWVSDKAALELPLAYSCTLEELSEEWQVKHEKLVRSAKQIDGKIIVIPIIGVEKL